MVHTPFESRIKLYFSGQTKRMKAPGNDSRGFKGRISVRSNDYRFKGKGTNRLAEPVTAADPNAMSTSGVDCPLNATTKRYSQLSFCNWFFMSAPF
jgi:hypothetical protein